MLWLCTPPCETESGKKESKKTSSSHGRRTRKGKNVQNNLDGNSTKVRWVIICFSLYHSRQGSISARPPSTSPEYTFRHRNNRSARFTAPFASKKRNDRQTHKARETVLSRSTSRGIRLLIYSGVCPFPLGGSEGREREKLTDGRTLTHG